MKFVKKPVVIDARRLREKLEIKTREGTLSGYHGDWLITGVEGEKYPCDNAIFRKTYSPLDDMLNPCSWEKYDKLYPFPDKAE